MPFIVRILTDDETEDLKFFPAYGDAERRFSAAWILMREEIGEPIGNGRGNSTLIGRLRSKLKVASVERVELHECRSSSPFEAAAEVRNGESTIRHWRDTENVLGDILEDLEIALDGIDTQEEGEG
jgi:hypothetical protein